MIKYLITCIIILSAIQLPAQKYALIDQSLAQPLKYAHTVTAKEIQDGFIPVESNHLPALIRALELIESDLKNNTQLNSAREFRLGCTIISGETMHQARENRYSYIIRSDCNQLNASYQLCNFKFKNATNAFIVKTWIKYIRAGIKTKKIEELNALHSNKKL